MTRPEPDTQSAEARLGKRAHLRRKLAPMAYVELGQSNGGILLNLSEGGFAVQCALSLTSREFPELRFQVPAHQGWLTARGRIVWLSDSKKEAGIQFTELPGEARREIYKWVSTEGEPAKATERFPSPSRGIREPSRPIAGTLHRGGITSEPPSAHIAHGNAAQRGAAAPETTAVAVAEPPAQDFRFTDYSMFAEVPEKEAVWAQPAKHRGRGVAALLVLAVAALFFVLGATVGRETVDQWLSELGWAQSPTTPGPKVTPPAPPEQPAAAEATPEKGVSSPETATAKDSQDPATGSALDSPATSAEAKPAEENKQVAQQPAPTEEASSSSPANGGRAASATSRNGIAASGARERKVRSVDVLPPVSDVDPSSIGTEHSILVSTPGPGSRPFYVNLPGETISASRTIAMSARRTLEIQPTASGGSARVIIGKLRTHSEPFYPTEARAQRLEGSVELRARVGRTGQIIGVTPISGSGLLMSAAAAAVREWRYDPTYVGGDPAETLADITIVFRLP